MKNFYIRQKDLLETQNAVRENLDGLHREMEGCILQLDSLLGDTSFCGEFATAVKLYFSRIHVSLLQAAVFITEAFQEEMQYFVRCLDAVEQKPDYVLNHTAMEYISARVQEALDAFENCVCEVSRVRAQMLPVLDLPDASDSLVGEETRGLLQSIRAFGLEIEACESEEVSRLSLLEELVEAFSKSLRIVRQQDGAFYAGDTNAVLTQISPLIALMNLVQGRVLMDTPLDEKRISFLQELGYTPGEILTLFKSCSSEEERAFFMHLAGQEYDRAFGMDPGLLSEEMDLLLADFAFRIFTGEERTSFEAFNNAILRQTAECVTDEFHWAIAGRREYRNAYVERLFAGTMLLLDLNSCAILAGTVSDEIRNRNWTYITLATIWNAEYGIMDAIGTGCDQDLPFLIDFTEEIPELNRTAFQFMYYEQPFLGRRKVQVIPVRTDVLETSRDLFTMQYLTRRRELEQEAEQLWAEVLKGGFESAASGLLSILLPQFSLAYGLVKALFTKPADLDNQVQKIEKETREEKDASDSGGISGMLLGEAVDVLQSYHHRNQEILQAIRSHDESYQDAIWGSGGIARFQDTTLLFTGLYNPDYLQTIGNWNREGIRALLPDLDPKALGQSSLLEQYGILPGTLPYRMLYGFADGSILDYPIREIAEAKSLVEDVIRLTDPRYAGWNVEDAF